MPWTQRCIITEQLLHEAEYDMKSYAERGGYPPKPKAWARWITPSEISISSYHTKAEFNNSLIIHSKYFHGKKMVTENNLVNDIKVTVHHLIEKCQNYALCITTGMWSLVVRIYVAVFVLTAGLNVAWWPELYTIFCGVSTFNDKVFL